MGSMNNWPEMTIEQLAKEAVNTSDDDKRFLIETLIKFKTDLIYYRSVCWSQEKDIAILRTE